MERNTRLHILWTSDNAITAEKMVFMYAVNALLNGWWERVTVIVWGAPAKLVTENGTIRENVRQALAKGVHISACKACADQLEVTDDLRKLGIDVKYWGAPLTEIIKNHEPLLTV